jgi:hypothetical protein
MEGSMMNYDLNIWDRVGYETNYQETGWSISVYKIPSVGASYGSGEFVTSLDLDEQDVEMLTLGKRQRDGGDYTEDNDFWIDLESFFVTYRNIPIIVKAFLTSLYESKEGKDELLSVWQELGARNS